MLRIFYIGGGGVLGLGLFIAYLTGMRGMTAQDAKNYLTGLIFVEFATILLVATNVAATAISKEKESGTLDLLLSTPLTSRYIIWGKLRGLISFTLPLILVPVATCGLFSVQALFTGSGAAGVVFPETVLILAGLMLIFAASACMLGIYRSLMSKTTLHAVLSSIAILVLAGGATSMCGLQIVDNGSPAAAVLAPFTPFTAIFVAVDPVKWMGLDVPVSPATLRQVRGWSAAGGALVVVIYGAIVHAAYRSMVRNFDMTLRKQSA
jgi:ABC-type transport system involved in multi-copper enzyme maturation permease subunit